MQLIYYLSGITQKCKRRVPFKNYSEDEEKNVCLVFSCLLVHVWDRWIVGKWKAVHTCNIWIVCVHTLWINTRKEVDEDWFNVVLVEFCITFMYEGLMVLSWDTATLIPWTSETEEAEVLSDMSDEPQWKYNSLGQSIAFSYVGWMECVLSKWKSTRMVQQIQVFLEVKG